MALGFAGRLIAAPAPFADVRIETARMVLRPLGPADAPALVRHLSEHAVSRWLARVPYPYGIADANAFVEHVRLAALAGTAVTVGLTDREDPTGLLMGVAALHSLDGTPEFGYWLGRRYWGRGLMTEAVGALLTWCFASITVPMITSGAFTGNDASLAIQARFGFQREGLSRRPCIARGGLVDHVDTRLLREDFRPPAP